MVGGSGSLVCVRLIGGSSMLARSGRIEVFASKGRGFGSLISSVGGTTSRVRLRCCVFGESGLKGDLVGLLARGTGRNMGMELLCSRLNSEDLRGETFGRLVTTKKRVRTFFPSQLRFVGLEVGCQGRHGVTVVSNQVKCINKFGIKSRCLKLGPGFKC